MKDLPLVVLLAGLCCIVIATDGQAASGKPASKQQIAHGEYLVKGVAGCPDCHSPMNEKANQFSQNGFRALN
jgi:hypothetical protein